MKLQVIKNNQFWVVRSVDKGQIFGFFKYSEQAFHFAAEKSGEVVVHNEDGSVKFKYNEKTK